MLHLCLVFSYLCKVFTLKGFGKFKLYNVDLKNLTPGIHEFEYLLENKFLWILMETKSRRAK